MTEREKLAAKIRALRAKTVPNGCTEDEALSAAEKVAELLARYNMTLDEAEMRASPFDRQTAAHEDLVGERLWKPAAAIAELTGARYWVSRPGANPVEITFFGFAHEVDVAHYLLDICAGAMKRHQVMLERGAQLLRPAMRRRRVLPFLDGMADRLRVRIRALKPTTPAGRGLVVVRTELIARAMADAGFQTEPGSARASRDHEASYQAGQREADGVALNRGLGGAGSPALRLGGRG